ncbi:MAG: HAD family phosphatase [Longicatena sp.]
MIKNIVFDIGNVLMSFQPIEYFKPIFKDKEKTKMLCDKVFKHQAWSLYDQGIYFMEDLYREYEKAYPNEIEDIKVILHDWLHLLQPMHSSLSYMKALKAEGYKLFILSNISKDSADYLKATQSFFLDVEGYVLSYEEKLNKPSEQIYKTLCTRYLLEPHETIFMDDKEENVLSAKKLGIHGVVFVNIEQTKKEVSDIIDRSKTC